MESPLTIGLYQRPSYRIVNDTIHILEQYIQQITVELGGREAFGREELLRAYLKLFLIQIQRKKNELEQSSGNLVFASDEKRIKLIKFTNLVDEN